MTEISVETCFQIGKVLCGFLEYLHIYGLSGRNKTTFSSTAKIETPASYL